MVQCGLHRQTASQTDILTFSSVFFYFFPAVFYSNHASASRRTAPTSPVCSSPDTPPVSCSIFSFPIISLQPVSILIFRVFLFLSRLFTVLFRACRTVITGLHAEQITLVSCIFVSSLLSLVIAFRLSRCVAYLALPFFFF